MRVFVTGGSGFVGGHAIEAMVAAGHTVCAMARSEASAARVRAYGAEPVAAALDTVDASHLAGVDAVVHAAAFAEEWGTRAQFQAVNVEGTRRLLAAAREAGVRRFVHVSTEAVLFDGADLVDVDETAPLPARHRFLYPETKAAAERLVLAANAPDFTTLAVRPRLVWGPRDETLAPVLRRMAAEGSFAWLDGGRARTSTTHVANLAHALLLALSAGRGGEAYFVADDGTRTLREVLGSLVAPDGVALPDRDVPGWLARPAAIAMEAAWSAVGRKPPTTAFAAAMMSRTVTVRTDKARAELGYAPVVSVEAGLRALAAPVTAAHSGV